LIPVLHALVLFNQKRKIIFWVILSVIWGIFIQQMVVLYLDSAGIKNEHFALSLVIGYLVWSFGQFCGIYLFAKWDVKTSLPLREQIA